MKEFRSEYNIRVRRYGSWLVSRGYTWWEVYYALYSLFIFFVFVILLLYFFFPFCALPPRWKYHNNYYCYKPFPAREKRPEHPVVPLCVGLINNYYSDKFARRTGGGDGNRARRFPGPSSLNAKSFSTESQCAKSNGTIIHTAERFASIHIFLPCCRDDNNNYLKQNKNKPATERGKKYTDPQSFFIILYLPARWRWHTTIIYK